MSTLPLTPKSEALLKSYIELDTSRPDGKNYPAAIKLLKEFLASIHFECTEIIISEKIARSSNRVNLIAKKFIDKKLPTLVCYNHIDVVPALYPDAFHFRSDKDKIYGRGACDHKGSTAVLLSALEKIKDQPLRFNLIFLATTDEETDQKKQLAFLASKLKLPKDTLIFDPDTFAEGVTVGHLGCLQLDISVHGKSVHSASSHLGVNAIEQASQLFEFFADEKKLQESQQSREKPFPSSQSTHVVSRCNVNMISGGIAPNVVPDICHLSVDYRFIPENSVADEKIKIFKRFEAFCHKHEISAKLEVKAEHEGYISHHPEIDRLEKIHAKYSKLSGQYGVMGSTPAAAWAKELQLPHFGIGIARGETLMHGVGEFAYIEDMVSLEKTLIEFLKPE